MSSRDIYCHRYWDSLDFAPRHVRTIRNSTVFTPEKILIVWDRLFAWSGKSRESTHKEEETRNRLNCACRLVLLCVHRLQRTTDYYIRFSSDLDFPRINSFTLYLIFGIFIVIIYKYNYYEKLTKYIPNFISNIISCLFHVSIKTELERG